MVPHRRRLPHDPRVPVHVTLRAAAGVESLRGSRVFAAMRRSLAASSGVSFRVLHFSVQRDHVHLLVEADGGMELARGCQGLAVRLAAAYAAPSPKRPDLCSAELPEAHRGSTRHGSPVVRGLVRRLASPATAAVRARARAPAAYVAGARRVAATREDRWG